MDWGAGMEREYICRVTRTPGARPVGRRLSYTPLMVPPPTSGSLVLALDTGSPWVSVALARIGGGEVAAVRAAPMERSSNQALEMMREVLAEVGARPADLGGVIALRGPGSFTGLRIGLATALGLHQALGIPATGLSTFEILAAAAASAEVPRGALILAAADALRGEWSVQPFRSEGHPLPLGEPELVAAGGIATLFDRWGAPPDGRLLAGFNLDPSTALSDPATGIRRFTPGPESPLAAVAALRAGDPSVLWEPGRLADPLYSRPPATTLARPRSMAPAGP